MQKRELRIKTIYIIAAVMTAILLLLANSRSPILGLLIYILLPIGLLKPEYLIPVYFISSLSSNYFVAAQGIGFTRLLALAIIVGVVFKLDRKRIPLQNKWIFNCVFITVTTFVSYLLSYDSNISPLYIMGLNILVLIAMTNLSLKKDELIQLFSAILLAVLITTVYYALEIKLHPDFLQNGRLTIADDVNENRFAMMTAQLSAYCLSYLFFSKMIYVKAVCLVAGVANAYFVLLSGSRSALIGIALGFVFAVLISGYVQKKIIMRTFGIIILCIAVVNIFYNVIEANPTLLYRMNIDTVISSGGTNRWPRVVGEMQYIIPNHSFWGVGPGSVNEQISLAQYIGDPGSSHNFIISPLAQVGFVGFVAYMGFYWEIMREIVSKLRKQEILIIPLMLILTAIFNGIGEVIYSERLFWNVLSLGALCLATFSNENILNARKLSKSNDIQIIERPV